MHHGMGGGSMRAVWEQRRSLQYLEDGGKPSKETLRRLWQVLRPHRRRLALALGLTLLGVLVNLVPPLLVRAIINHALTERNVGLLLWLVLGLVAFPVAGALVAVGQNYLNTVVSQGIIHDLRMQLYRHGQWLGVEFFTRTPGGEIHSRLINDLNAVQTVLSRTMSGWFVNALTVTLTLSTMFWLNWRLALVSAFILPLFALPVLSYGRRSYEAMAKAQTALARLATHLEETLTLSGYLVVKSFGTRLREAAAFERLSDTVQTTQVQQSMVGQWLSLIVNGLSAMGPALLYGYGGYLVITGRVELGTVVAFATYLGQLYQPASSLAGSNTTLIGGLALFDRIFSFLDLPVAVPDPTEPMALAVVPGVSTLGVRFDAVRFGYRPDEEVLHGISFTAEPGQLTAIVGPSGAGKSTVLALAARLYDPWSGKILINEVPIDGLAEATLRHAVSVVTQELFLFHTTLDQNIRYGRPEATDHEVAMAVAAAQLDELVASLPAGLETVVGERGYRLSGGEKQRVAIARAILKNPSILLLDEATSSLDSHAERLIQQALARLFHGRTVIAIAHRLSTVLAADQILVMKEGRIHERGRHLELLGIGGLYAQLYHEQFDTRRHPAS